MIAGALTVLAIALWRGVHVAAWRELDEPHAPACRLCLWPLVPVWIAEPIANYPGTYCQKCANVIVQRRLDAHEAGR